VKDRGPPDPYATTEAAGPEAFLQRWSRRKAEARRPASQVPEPAPEAAAPQPAAPPDPQPEPAPLTDADMPPLDTLDESSDLSPFFSRGVSEELRRRALRKIFSLAAYNVRDGLNDYDEDYTHFEPLGNTITADMRHRQEREALEREQAEAERRASAQTAEQRAPAEVPAEAPPEDAGEAPARTAATPAEPPAEGVAEPGNGEDVG